MEYRGYITFRGIKGRYRLKPNIKTGERHRFFEDILARLEMDAKTFFANAGTRYTHGKPYPYLLRVDEVETIYSNRFYYIGETLQLYIDHILPHYLSMGRPKWLDEMESERQLQAGHVRHGRNFNLFVNFEESLITLCGENRLYCGQVADEIDTKLLILWNERHLVTNNVVDYAEDSYLHNVRHLGKYEPTVVLEALHRLEEEVLQWYRETFPDKHIESDMILIYTRYNPAFSQILTFHAQVLNDYDPIHMMNWQAFSLLTLTDVKEDIRLLGQSLWGLPVFYFANSRHLPPYFFEGAIGEQPIDHINRALDKWKREDYGERDLVYPDIATPSTTRVTVAYTDLGTHTAGSLEESPLPSTTRVTVAYTDLGTHTEGSLGESPSTRDTEWQVIKIRGNNCDDEGHICAYLKYKDSFYKVTVFQSIVPPERQQPIGYVEMEQDINEVMREMHGTTSLTQLSSRLYLCDALCQLEVNVTMLERLPDFEGDKYKVIKETRAEYENVIRPKLIRNTISTKIVLYSIHGKMDLRFNDARPGFASNFAFFEYAGCKGSTHEFMLSAVHPRLRRFKLDHVEPLNKEEVCDRDRTKIFGSRLVEHEKVLRQIREAPSYILNLRHIHKVTDLTKVMRRYYQEVTSRKPIRYGDWYPMTFVHYMNSAFFSTLHIHTEYYPHTKLSRIVPFDLGVRTINMDSVVSILKIKSDYYVERTFVHYFSTRQIQNLFS